MPRGLSAVVVLCAVALLPPALSSMSGDQAPGAAGAPPPAPPPVRLTKAEAEQLAADARAKVKAEVPNGLELSIWAPERLVTDPIAIDVDPQGTVYVTSSSRNNLPLDIRGHQDWMPIVHTLKSVEDLRAFYRKVMAPENSARNGWIQDVNKDGSRDIRDLATFKERLHRVQDTDGDGIADFSQVMKEGFNEDPTWDVAGGVMYHEGDIIFGVPPGVYRLRDTNGDGTIEQQTTILDGFNTHPAFGGHGISGVMQGPDGRLYWEVGDIGFNVVDRSGKRWLAPNQGGVFRSDFDGSNFEVFAAGIRNLQEFSFDEYGNLISVDNDGDHQGEAERVVYIPYGSDSGWRSNWQYGKYTDPKNNRYNVWMDEAMFRPRHAGQTAHIVPPVANWHAGPSGMAYNPGTALSEEWRKHFFVTSFPGAPGNARIFGFTLTEDGAGFKMGSEKQLLRGVLAVGIRFGPEGALYITDWITGWDSKNNGRLWKLDAPAVAGSPIRKEVQALLAQNFADRTAADLSQLLRHADMRIRQKAQFDLVRRGDVQPLLTAARDTSHQLARIHGIWGIAQLARKDAQHAGHLAAFLKDGDGEIRAQAAKMIGDVRHAAAAEGLLPLLMDTAPRARFFAAEALGRIAHRAATPALIDMLADNDGHDVYIHHAGSLALASIGDAGALEALAKHDSRAVRTAAIVALRRMGHAGVARFLQDSDEQVVTDAARAINDDGSIRAAVPELAARLTESRFKSAPLLRRAINANLRVGTSEALERVARFAGDAGRPEDLRLEAVAVLGIWPSPSPMDRVDGFYLAPFEAAGAAGTGAQAAAGPRASAGVRQAAAAAVQRLIDAAAKGEATAAGANMKIALAEAAGRLEVRTAAPLLLAQLRTDPSPQVRLASLRALQEIKVGSMDELMQIALADKDPAVRRAALGILPGLKMTSAAKVQHLAALIKDGSLAEKQGAMEVLGTLKTAESRKLLGAYLDDLAAGTLAPELQVDLVDAIQADESAPLAARLETYQKSRKAETLVLAFRDALLNGGDPMRGQQVVTQNPAAECTRCHSIRGRGADVGPNLSNIASVLTREQLLESLIEPNKRIAPGYGTVGITLRNGQRVDGTLREETDTHVVLMVGDPQVERRISKADIAERTNPVSAMPPFGLILKPREIRDLVAFLGMLK
jgi:putative membrane-bound dehydrogenase-like protein